MKKIKRITKAQAVAIFGNQSKVAEALGIHKMAVSKWKEGDIPLFQDLRLRNKFPESFPAIDLSREELLVWIMEQMA